MKKVWLLFLILFVTGCTANYNLVIDNEYIDEDVTITVPISGSDEDLFYSQTSFLSNVYLDRDDFYESSISDDDDNYYANYKFKHKISDYGKSKFIVKCFSSNDIYENDYNISFETSKGFNCIDMEDGAHLDEVVFNITTPLKVIDSNADEVHSNTYSWIFNKDNYKDKSVIIHLSKNIPMDEENRNILIIFLIVLVCFLIIFGLWFTNVRRKMSKSNEF